jgi:hypothetical protein
LLIFNCMCNCYFYAFIFCLNLKNHSCIKNNSIRHYIKIRPISFLL